MIGKRQITNTYLLQRRCHHCLGKGHIVVHRCSECGFELETGQLADEDGEPVHPCAHSRGAYVALEMVCAICEGLGSVYDTVSEEEYNAARGRKFRRGIVLLMVALGPLAALGWAVVNTEPSAVCGSWWYGVLLPMAIFGGQVRRS